MAFREIREIQGVFWGNTENTKGISGNKENTRGISGNTEIQGVFREI